MFKNKKAVGNEIDWIIAMGIFSIYLLMTIVYFRPGINPVFNADNLIGIVEDNFMKDTTWSISSQPLFLEATKYKCGYLAPGKSSSDSDAYIYIDADLATSPPPETPPLALSCYNQNGNSKQVTFVGKDTSTPFLTTLGLSGLTEENLKVFFVGRTTTEADKLSNDLKINIKNVGDRTEINCIKKKAELGKRKQEILNNPLLRKQDVNSICKDTIKTIHEGNKITNKEVTDIDKLCKDFMELLTEEEGCLSATNPQDKGKYVTPKEYTPAPYELRPNYVKFKIDNNNLIFVPFFVPCDLSESMPPKTKYMLIYSNDIINLESPLEYSSIPQDTACITTILGCGINSNSQCHATYEIGSAETSTGISLRKIDLYSKLTCDNNQNGYNCVKKIWGYPEAKEFKIRVFDTSQNLIAEFPKEIVVPSNVNVYSKYFNAYMLSEDNVRRTVTVSILVW